MSTILEKLKKLKYSYPWLWNIIESINGLLIKALYGQQLKRSITQSLKQVSGQYVYRCMYLADADKLLQFINAQPDGFDTYFKPHAFDLKTFRRVLSNGTYILIGSFDDDKLIGYCFIRFFVNKSAFRGKIVDKKYQGIGIAKQMGQIMTNIAADAGFRVYATISKYNVASMQSAKSGAQIRVIKELPDDYLYIEIMKDRNHDS